LAQIEIRSISKRFDTASALTGVSLSVAQGEIVCLLGPSGCGKTTLLRIVAGLEQADQGEVIFDGRSLHATPVHQRNFGLMFQEFALFPDKTVGQNVAFGLRMANLPRAEISERVAEMLALVSLAGYEPRTIFQLSGGERQRVALARSLAPRPQLLMLDEPLGSLDRTLRESLMMELRAILKRLGMTALYVTHDQQEALAIADRVVVLDRGHIAQLGAPREIYLQPANPFVARFLGFANLFAAQVTPAAPSQANSEIGELPLVQSAPPGAYTLLVRPDALLLGGTDGLPRFRGVVTQNSFRGSHVRLEVLLEKNQRLVFEAPNDVTVVEGAQIDFAINPLACGLLAAESATPPAPAG
jgi:ABC-type Fe3+/spermidine/putrescine transport system ATPase subunit